MKYIFIVAGLLLLKSLMNLVKVLQCKYYLTQYVTWLSTDNVKNIFETKSKVIKLISSAGVKDVAVPWTQAIGYGYINTSSVSVLRNYPSRYEELAPRAMIMFEEAIGVYKSRCIEGFNPFFWIEFVCFLPKNLLVYLGLNPENVSVKVLQVIWWAACLTTSFAVAFFRRDALIFLKGLIERMLQ